jgi:hypothetical protein
MALGGILAVSDRRYRTAKLARKARVADAASSHTVAAESRS